MTNPEQINESERILREYQRRDREIPKDFYSLEKPGNRFLNESRKRRTAELLKKHGTFPLKDKKILEIGCGLGNWFADLKDWGALESDLSGIDLDQSRMRQTKDRFPKADLRVGDASHLPWSNKSFDIVLQSTVFTSILNSRMKEAIASEMTRVLKPGGFILWYDFFRNNPWNAQVRGVGAGEIKNLFPGCKTVLKRVTLAPPLARALAPHSPAVCALLENFRFLNTHYLGILQVSS
jgi:SAM-dependent methyltransferase